ncbi:MAG: hypothetical protein JNJ42_08885 [Burkholderiaceae bacterium]|nr:hypothetical protein [Burkholderiaceae bacterium]
MAAALPSTDKHESRNARESSTARSTRSARDEKKGWLGTLFSRELKIKRIGMQLHVVLEAPAGKPSQHSGAGSRGEALRLAHLALQKLLDQHDDVRRMMPHLHHLEKSLAQVGSRALKTLPPDVMNKAMDQLDLIEGSAQSPDLLTLRLRVEEAIRRRTPAKLRDDLSAIEVTDASHSQFDEADRIWTGVAPLDEANPDPVR